MVRHGELSRRNQGCWACALSGSQLTTLCASGHWLPAPSRVAWLIQVLNQFSTTQSSHGSSSGKGLRPEAIPSLDLHTEGDREHQEKCHREKTRDEKQGQTNLDSSDVKLRTVTGSKSGGGGGGDCEHFVKTFWLRGTLSPIST